MNERLNTILCRVDAIAREKVGYFDEAVMVASFVTVAKTLLEDGKYKELYQRIGEVRKTLVSNLWIDGTHCVDANVMTIEFELKTASSILECYLKGYLGDLLCLIDTVYDWDYYGIGSSKDWSLGEVLVNLKNAFYELQCGNESTAYAYAKRAADYLLSVNKGHYQGVGRRILNVFEFRRHHKLDVRNVATNDLAFKEPMRIGAELRDFEIPPDEEFHSMFSERFTFSEVRGSFETWSALYDAVCGVDTHGLAPHVLTSLGTVKSLAAYMMGVRSDVQ